MEMLFFLKVKLLRQAMLMKKKMCTELAFGIIKMARKKQFVPLMIKAWKMEQATTIMRVEKFGRK